MRCRMGVFLVGAAVLLGSGTQAQAGETMERFSEMYDSPELIPEPEEELLNALGDRYELTGVFEEEVPAGERTETVEGEILYEDVGAGDRIPETAGIAVWDGACGQTVQRTLPLFDTEFSDERWKDDFSFTATFHGYGSDMYLLGDLRIPGEADEPALKGYESQLLALIGLGGEDFMIDHYRWDGGSYLDEDSVPCRDVRVSGRRKVRDCRAIYRGEASFPVPARSRKRYVYTKVEREAAAPAAETLSSSQEETPAAPENGGGWDSFLKLIKTYITVIIRPAVILAVLAALWFLVRLAGKLKEEKKRGER